MDKFHLNQLERTLISLTNTGKAKWTVVTRNNVTCYQTTVEGTTYTVPLIEPRKLLIDGNEVADSGETAKNLEGAARIQLHEKLKNEIRDPEPKKAPLDLFEEEENEKKPFRR